MAFRPFFFDGPAGRLFAIHHPPEASAAPRGNVIYVPPFAEEMNRSRRMATVQAGRLAKIGVGVLVLDLYGTGDSEGEFGEATWQTWTADVGAALDWLEASGAGPVGLWGLRLGAILALEATRAWPERISRLVLWQPVIRGARQLEQFLRVRVAASMGYHGEQESTKALRETLAKGDAVEVAGYVLAPALAAALDAADLAALAPPPRCRVDWLEVVAAPEAGLSPAGRRVAEGWRAVGVDVAAHAVAGEPFWALQTWDVQAGILVPELWEATTAVWSDAL